MNARTLLPTTPLTLEAEDGRLLGAMLHEAASPRAVVLIAGATAVPQRYYARFAGWLSERGFTTLTLDYRGIGGSRHHALPDEPATMHDWGALDLPAGVARLRRLHPDLPLLVVAHSFGGQALALSDALASADGVLTVGSQLGWIGHWPTLARWRFRTVWHLLAPTLLATHGYLPGWSGLGEDLPGGVAREWRRWCLSPGYLFDHVEGAAERLRDFDGALEVWGFTDDDFGPERAVRAYADAIRPTGRTLRILDPGTFDVDAIGHFGMFRPRFRASLWEDAAEVLRGWSA